MLITAISAAAFRDIIVEDTSLDLSPPSSTMSSLSSGNGADASICPPLRFAKLFDGLSRSAYPTLKNFRFMRRLQLKTIGMRHAEMHTSTLMMLTRRSSIKPVSLVPEPPTRDLADFCALFSINLVHIRCDPLRRHSLRHIFHLHFVLCACNSQCEQSGGAQPRVARPAHAGSACVH